MTKDETRLLGAAVCAALATLALMVLSVFWVDRLVAPVSMWLAFIGYAVAIVGPGGAWVWLYARFDRLFGGDGSLD